MRTALTFRSCAFLCTTLLIFSAKIRAADDLHKDISFKDKEITIQKSTSEDKLVSVLLKLKSKTGKESFKDYTVGVSVDAALTTVAPSSYKIDYRTTTLEQLKNTDSYVFYITVNKDSLPDRDRMLVLNLVVKDEKGNITKEYNQGETVQMSIRIISVKDTALANYNYLGYVGTNFDLVDGIHAQNLFFAANIFLPPTLVPKNKVGLYLSLYGNRTLSATDSSTGLRRTTRITRLTDSTYRQYSMQQSQQRTTVADNLGAYIAPLINLWHAGDPDNRFQVYYAPSLEFIWRRIHQDYTYSGGTNIDSVTLRGSANSLDIPNQYSRSSNVYNFQVGFVGLFICHETKRISMRVHMGVTLLRKFYPAVVSSLNNFDTPYDGQTDWAFSGKAWITEASSGITLQAEITNTMKFPQPYYGVTLSKAFDFKHLGNFFQPVSGR